MSAPLRYARILKGLSFLISKRSAISLRIRAMPGLSKPQALGLDPVVEHARAALGQRLDDCRARGGRAVAEQASTAARAADLGGGGAGRGRARDERLDRRRRHTGRKTLAGVPLHGDLATDFVPVIPLKGRAHGRRRVPDPLEAVEDLAVAVEMTFRDVPVVRGRVARRACIGQHDAAFELARVDVETDAPDTAHAELHGGDAAVQSWTIVLHARWDADRLALDVHRDHEQG